MKPDKILLEAAGLVSGDRAATHGDFRQTYALVARLWSAWLGVDVSTEDVLQMLSLMKKARTQHGSENPDDYVDDAGYVGLAGAKD